MSNILLVTKLLNKETKFVLDYFGFKEPEFLNDVRIQIKNMHYNKDAMLEEHFSIYEGYKYLNKLGVTGFPLVNKQRKLIGYVNVKQISKYLIEGDINYLNTSYDNIIDVLKGEEILKFNDEIEGTIMAAAFRSTTILNTVEFKKDKNGD